MRNDLPASVLNAYENPDGYRVQGRMTVYLNRLFFEAADFIAYPSSLGVRQAPGLHLEDPLPQDVIYCAELNKLVTMYNNSGEIVHILEGLQVLGAVKHQDNTPLEALSWCRPTLVESADQLLLYYQDTDFNLCCARLNTISFKIEEEWILASAPGIGQLYGLSDRAAVFLWIDDGGVRVTYLSAPAHGETWTLESSPGRMMFPLEVWPSDSICAARLNFAGAAQTERGVFAYLTQPDGSVVGIRRNPNGTWSDFFTAVPQDLTCFAIANVLVDNQGRVHMCGQFARRKNDTEYYDEIYNLALWSDDGETFSLDRFTLVSTTGYRLMLSIAPDRVIFSDAGRMASGDPYWPTHQTLARNVQIPDEDIKSISVTVAEETRVQIAAGADTWRTEPLLSVGNVVTFDLGVYTTEGITYVRTMTCILASIERETRSGKNNYDRRLTLTLTPDSLWRCSNMIYPFYLEFQGKQAVFDDTDELDNLYSISESKGVPVPFSVDFADMENPFVPSSHTSGENIHYSQDLTSKGLEDYPVIETFPITAKIYGWSRIGLPTTNPNSPSTGPNYDTTNAELPNDEFIPVFVVKGPGSNDEERIVTIPTSMASVTYPPQTWKEGNSRAETGTNPVVYTITDESGLSIGDKIIKVGAKVKSGGAPTVYYLERMEIQGVTMYLRQTTLAWAKSEVPNYSSDELLIDDELDIDNLPADVGFTLVTGSWSKNQIRDTYRVIDVVLTFENLLQNPAVSFTYTRNGGYWSRQLVEYKNASGAILKSFTNERNPSVVGTFEADWPEGRNIKYVHIRHDFPYSDGGNWGVIDNIHVNYQMNGSDGEVTKKILQLTSKGVPSVMFSAKPYSAFNFQASGQYKLSGSNTWAGVVGLAKDGRNLIGARVSSEKVQLFCSRGGVDKVLAEAANTRTEFAVLLEHRDGLFRVYLRSFISSNWGDPLIEYSWKFTDGPLATDSLFHVGIYGYIDVPRFRITPFDVAISPNLGVLPGSDLSIFNNMPSSGYVEIDGVRYSYTGKITGDKTPRGPFQYRNTGQWSYSESGQSFSGKTVEITYFDWLDNPSHHDDWAGYLLATAFYMNVPIVSTDWKPTITTNEEITWLLNRARFFCQDADSDGSTYDKAWVTVGLTGLKAVSGDAAPHSEGALCYQSTEGNTLEIHGFQAASAERNLTITDLLDRITRMAGGHTAFPGDIAKTNLTLNSTGTAI